MANKTTDWYKDWFNSPYYGLLYANRDEAEAEGFIQALLGKFDLKAGTRILDAPCGSGRHSRTLAKMGFTVTGIDLSPAQIQIANEHKVNNETYLVKDLRDLQFENEFDIVLNLFTSLGYFENHSDNQLVINGFYKALKKDSLLLIDFLNSVKLLNNLITNETIEKNGVIYNITRKLNDKRVIKEMHIIDNNNQTEHHFQEQVELINLEAFADMLQKAGFKMKDVWGDYDGRAWSPACNRLILVAKKF